MNIKTQNKTLARGIYFKILNANLKTWSNIIFIIAFIIPAITLLSLGIISTSFKIKNESLIKITNNLNQTIHSYQNSLKIFEEQTVFLSDNTNLRLLVGAIINVNQYQAENPLIREWLTELLKQLKKSQNLTGIAVIALNKKVLAHTHDQIDLPRLIADSTLIDAGLYRSPVSGNQLVPVSLLRELNIVTEQPEKLPGHIILQLATVPILENNKMIGMFVMYRFLHQQTSWIKNLGDDLQVDVAVYAKKNLLMQQSVASTFAEHFVKFIAFGNLRSQVAFHQKLDNELENRASTDRSIDLDDYEKEAVGTILIRTRVDQYFNEIITSLLLLLVLISAGILLGIVFRIWTFRILSLIRDLVVSIRDISKGNYSNLIPINRKDEIGELSEEINKMAEEIQRREKFKDDFLANTSHELKTPLQGIIGIAESLQDGATGALPLQTRKQLEMITQSGNRLSRLINDILDYAKLKNADLVLETKPTDIFPLVDIVFRLSKPLIEKKDLELINLVSSSTPLVECDEERTFQIVFNLIGNAIKFTKSGSVTVMAKIVGQMLEISVKDTGIGIPEEQTDLIFQSFQQATHSLEHQFGGTGLGLSISKYLVELQGGRLSVESTDEKGSRFYFTLPISHNQNLKNIPSNLHPDEKYTTIPLPNIDQSPQTKFNKGIDKIQFEIMIVDDEPINLQVISNYLIAHRYTVTKAVNGFDALKTIQHHKPDLVLLDVMMPGISGFEVCRQLRITHSMHQLPIIFLTAKNQVSDLLEGFSLGANDYITKPFQKNELLARVERHLELNRYTKRLSRLNQFSTQLVKFSNVSQMFDSAFHLICNQQLSQSGILSRKGKIIQDYGAPETDQIIELLNKVSGDDEIRCVNEPPNYHLVFIYLKGFEDFQMVIKRKGDSASFSAADQEYIQSIINLIRISRYNIEELLKEPNVLKALFKIQADLDSILYIKIKSPYCYVQLENQEQPWIHRISFQMLQRFFHEDLLLKIQRSYLVNPNKIRNIIRSGKNDVRVKMVNDEMLPLSRNLVDKIKNKYPGYCKF
ncbi:MAG: response regulator [Deltaproteobacteria bacterium]|jgi:signal transduction histidine kinase/DNA-binding LytR/AlgR family response regulator|nr:response regulator [Deltaproteobacteria bacterium]